MGGVEVSEEIGNEKDAERDAVIDGDEPDFRAHNVIGADERDAVIDGDEPDFQAHNVIGADERDAVIDGD
jgi:hypothetical protein